MDAQRVAVSSTDWLDLFRESTLLRPLQGLLADIEVSFLLLPADAKGIIVVPLLLLVVPDKGVFRSVEVATGKMLVEIGDLPLVGFGVGDVRRHHDRLLLCGTVACPWGLCVTADGDCVCGYGQRREEYCELSHRSNEKEVSYRHRGRARLGVEVV